MTVGQISIFELINTLTSKPVIDNLKVIESFAGIGSQRKLLS